jgi:Domain of unknown function (DUF5615)
VRVILDESVPRHLAPLLTGHSVTTVQREGMSGVTNGELLRWSSGRFDALITGDRGLRHQQNLAGLDLGLVVLVVPNNRVETILFLSPRILEALARLQPGEVVEVAA